MIKATYKMAMAAGKDAANRRMTSQGRTSWNRADYNHAAAVVEQLIGPAHENVVSLDS